MSSSSQRGTLIAAALGFVVVLLDVSVVNVALNTLRTTFNTDVSGLQWVVNAYTLAFASLLLTAGAQGDRWGARRLFILGLAIFTLASAACGLAVNLAGLIGARVFQGVGASLLVPNSLSMLQRAYPDKLQRSRAVGWWGAIASISLAMGPVLGGVIVTHWGWRSIFLINLPIGFVGTGLTLKYVSADAPGHRRSLDWLGQAAGVLTLIALTGALTEGARLGWRSAWVQSLLVAFAIAAAGFIHVESRAKSPMLPLALFRVRPFAVASICGVVVNFAYYGLIFVFSLFFQIERHLSPQQTGIAFLPMTLVLMVASVLAGRLIAHLGPRRLMVLGLLVAALGYLLLLPVGVEGAFGWLVVPMVLAASGTALTVPTMTNITLSSVDATRAGVASGVLSAARQVGGLLGVSFFGNLVRDTRPEAFVSGMHWSLGVGVALLLGACALCDLWFDAEKSGVFSEAESV